MTEPPSFNGLIPDKACPLLYVNIIDPRFFYSSTYNFYHLIINYKVQQKKERKLLRDKSVNRNRPNGGLDDNDLRLKNN